MLAIIHPFNWELNNGHGQLHWTWTLTLALDIEPPAAAMYNTGRVQYGRALRARAPSCAVRHCHCATAAGFSFSPAAGS
jgi:hypothetical protein